LFGEPTDSDEEPVADQPERPGNGSSPVQESGVPVPDKELRDRGLSRDDVRFLSRVLDVMNREDDEYALLDSMRQLRDDYEDLHLEQLKDQDLLDEGSAAGRKYYTVLPAGRDLLDKDLDVGPGAGDIGEKTPHKVGVEMLARWFEQLDLITRVETYYEHDSETVFDVVAFDDANAIAWVGEVELASKDSQDPIRDFEKMGQVEANAIWVFKNREEAETIIDILADAERLDPVTGRDRKSITRLRSRIESQGARGMTTFRTFQDIDSELE
jgi:DNA-binding PadR family transcriptional regulator